jgi:hypothetical protein
MLQQLDLQQQSTVLSGVVCAAGQVNNDLKRSSRRFFCMLSILPAPLINAIAHAINGLVYASTHYLQQYPPWLRKLQYPVAKYAARVKSKSLLL